MKRSKLKEYQLDQNRSNSSQKKQQSSNLRLKQQQLNLKLESKRIRIQLEQYQRQKEGELRQLQEKMQLLELEHEVRQCGGESERATIDGSKIHDVEKDSELDNKSVAGSEAMSGFIVPMVSQSDVRTNLSKDYQHNGSNDTPNENRFDFSTLTVKTEETPR